MDMDGTATLGAARDYVKAFQDVGVGCPCCGQFVKLYRRKLHHNLVVFLTQLWLHRQAGRDGVHYSELQKYCRDYHFLQHWGLAETGYKDDQTGVWRITQNGMDFVAGKLRVPAVLWLLNNKLVGQEPQMVGVVEALDEYFSYDELLKGVVRPLKGRRT